MSLSQDLISLLYTHKNRLLNPKAKKEIIYFVGASGCGKSTKINKLKATFGT